MALTTVLQRRVKPSKVEDDNIYSDDDSSSDEESRDRAQSIHSDDSLNESIDTDDQKKDGEEVEERGTKLNALPSLEPQESITDISFGALVAAQSSINLKRKRSTPHVASSLPNDPFYEANEREAGKNDHRTLSRISKHAPVELSSKKAVPRKREVIPVIKVAHRDPRFEPLTGNFNAEALKKNYSFLDTYRASEIATLKSTLRTTRDPIMSEQLKKKLQSMESQDKARARKEEQQEIIRSHRRQEQEAVKQGKKPFYLKKGQQKKLALVKKFEGLGEKKAEKVIERRRKKKAGRERREMPDGRRQEG